ncbi:helix-turn-helix domain-containing protein [Acidimangrovimonas pyrenivorans]|uniref:Helix-turn-helix domain-containing protein n=1 Tax=Acidimangrovimonas pyrenivorans TaxID=2030798 RepID=A0ABV7AE69_9RHOB
MSFPEVGMIDNNRLGVALREIREARGLTQLEVSRRARISTQTVSLIERTGEASWQSLRQIARALGLKAQLVISEKPIDEEVAIAAGATRVIDMR